MRSDLTGRPDRPPRGLPLCTGEMLPPGASIIARLIQVEVDRDRLDLAAVTAMQENGGRLAHAMRAYLEWLAPEYEKLQEALPAAREEMRRELRTRTGHLRQPAALANLYVALDLFLQFAESAGALDAARAQQLRDEALLVFEGLAARVTKQLGEIDPAERFVDVLTTLLVQGKVRLLDKATDRPPRADDAEVIGWTHGDRVLLLHGAAYLFDLGSEVGLLKTFIARGPFPPGSRYAVQGSIDGTHFDDLTLFDADQDGAKSVSAMCRFLRVQRFAFSGVAPAIAVGAEGLFDPGVALELTLSNDGERQTTSATDEEVLFQFPLPLKSLGSPIIGLSLASSSIQGTTPGTATFRVRLGGTPLAPDGAEILNLTDAAPSEKSVFGSAVPFPAPSDDVALVKVTGQGDGTLRPAMRGVALLFHRST
jgi:hypothetical protein